MKILSDFKNIYKNTPVLVMGRGASLNQYKKDIYDKCITIGVNRIGEFYTPDFLIFQDDFLPVDHPDYKDYSLIINSDSKYIFLMNYSKVKNKFKHQDRLVDIENIVLSINDENEYKSDYLYRSHTSPFLAASLALYMGSDLIGLIGVDLHGKDNQGKQDIIHDDVFRVIAPLVSNDMYKINSMIGNNRNIVNLSQTSHVNGISKTHIEYIKHFMIK